MAQENLQDWAEGTPAKTRGGIPGWAKFCGCGCLLVVTLFGLLFAVLARELMRAGDSELQKGLLAEVLPFDALPPEVSVGGWHRWMDLFVLNDERGYMWALYVGDEGSSRGGAPLSAEVLATTPFGFQGVDELVTDELEVQGRTLSMLRFLQTGAPLVGLIGTITEATEQGGQAPQEPLESDGASVLIDLTPSGGERLLLLFLVEVDARAPIPAERLRELLAPFRIGPEREVYRAPEPAPGAAPPEGTVSPPGTEPAPADDAQAPAPDAPAPPDDGAEEDG